MSTMSSSPESTHAVTVMIAREHADELEAWIRDAWAVPVVQFERPGAVDVRLDLYLESAAASALACRVLEERPGVKAVAGLHLGSREWEEIWKKHFSRHLIGEGLEICPVWEADEPPPGGRKRVLVNPGMSFGTGEHFTTRFCLEMLEGLCHQSPPDSLLDVGTGSGILAIAAAKLGVPRITATDSDIQAVETAKGNAKLNGVGTVVDFGEADITLSPAGGPYDVVCANLYAGILIEAATVLLRAAGQHLIVSGIRDVEVDGVADTFLRLGARELVRDGEGEWTGLMLATNG